MRYGKAALIFSLTLITNGLIRAEDEGVAQVLRLGAGARAAGMGEAFSAVADDATATYWNPAGMVNVANTSVALMHAAHLDSTFYDHAAFVKSTGRHAFGAGLQYLSYGDIEETNDTSSASVGSFNPNDLVFSLSYAMKVTYVSLGITGKYVRSQIIDSDSTLAGDLGLLTDRYLNDRLQHALTVTNVGGEIKYDSESESLPVAYRLGNSFRVTESWLLGLDGIFDKTDTSFAFGTEYAKKLQDGWRLAGRAGYNSRNKDTDGTGGISMGLGVGINKFALDYALSLFGDLGAGHKISIGWDFGANEKT